MHELAVTALDDLEVEAALLAKTPSPTDADIDDAMSGNICRCGTYVRIREAIKRAGRTRVTSARGG